MGACPAGTDIRGYQALLQLGDVRGALEKLKKSNPFPAITGRVCFHPCETQCARRHVDAPVNINGVEQFLGDRDLTQRRQARPSAPGPRGRGRCRSRGSFRRMVSCPHGV